MLLMNNKDLQVIFVSIKDLDIGNAKFKYFVWKNKKLIQDELEIIEKSLVISDEFKKYDSERVELCKTHSNKDESWEAIMINNSFDIIDKWLFTIDMKELQEKHKETLEAYAKQIEDYDKLLNEETQLELVKVWDDNIPDELEQKVLDVLIRLDLIKED